MNRLRGKIQSITNSGSITLVDIDTQGVQMTSIIVDRPENVTYLVPAAEVDVMFNESELSLGRITEGMISLNNQLSCLLKEIVPGRILSRVLLDFQGRSLVSLITTRSVARLNLRRGDRVTAFVKSTEVILKGVDVSSPLSEDGGTVGCL